MISSLIFCDSSGGGSLPRSNGYLLFSALSRLCAERAGLDLFHRTPGRKDFSLSPLLPSSFWWQPKWRSLPPEFALKGAQSWAFRICFYSDAVFEQFAEVCTGARLSLGGTQFEVTSVTPPGGDPFSASASFEQLMGSPPAAGAQFTFATPCGFQSRTDNMQRTLPSPDVLFPSLAMRWRNAAGEMFEKLDPDGIVLSSFDLCSSAAPLKRGSVARGCVGSAVYEWRGADERKRRMLTCLARFAFFSGVGYKTSQGLGQVFPSFEYEDLPA